MYGARAKRVPDTMALKNLYFFFMHCYLNYGNVVWISTSRAKLKKPSRKQNQALRIVNNQSETCKNIKT